MSESKLPKLSAEESRLVQAWAFGAQKAIALINYLGSAEQAITMIEMVEECQERTPERTESEKAAILLEAMGMD